MRASVSSHLANCEIILPIRIGEFYRKSPADSSSDSCAASCDNVLVVRADIVLARMPRTTDNTTIAPSMPPAIQGLLDITPTDFASSITCSANFATTGGGGTRGVVVAPLTSDLAEHGTFAAVTDDCRPTCAKPALVAVVMTAELGTAAHSLTAIVGSRMLYSTLTLPAVNRRPPTVGASGVTLEISTYS